MDMKAASMDNQFGVGAQVNRVVFLKPIPMVITKSEALNLAAYIVALADDDDEFDALLQDLLCS